MKISFSLALCAALMIPSALAVMPRVALAQPAALTAEDVLKTAAKTYAGFSVYKGTCSVVSDNSTKFEGKEPKQRIESATASIAFERGKSTLVTGVSSGALGGFFRALRTPNGALVESTLVDGRRQPIYDSSKPSGRMDFGSGVGIVSNNSASRILAALDGQDSFSPFRVGAKART